MSHHSSISAIFKGQVSLGAQVTVKGWLRSKRDSKAGISFLAVHDGSAFDAIQAVVPDTLAELSVPGAVFVHGLRGDCQRRIGPVSG